MPNCMRSSLVSLSSLQTKTATALESREFLVVDPRTTAGAVTLSRTRRPARRSQIPARPIWPLRIMPHSEFGHTPTGNNCDPSRLRYRYILALRHTTETSAGLHCCQHETHSDVRPPPQRSSFLARHQVPQRGQRFSPHHQYWPHSAYTLLHVRSGESQRRLP